MEKTNLFQDAVADAKLIRKLAIETAKSNLAETFTPKIKSMLATKLQEEEDIELDETVEETTEETQTAAPVVAEEETTMDEVNLDELLAELEAEEDAPVEEVVTTDEAPLEEEESDEVDLDELLEGEDEESEEEEQKVEDMSVEELTSLIKDIVKSEMGGGSEEETEEVPAEEEVEAEDTTELDEAKKKAAGKGKTHPYTELAEAKKAIDYLRNELNETNLLNAKLLYANKIFKAKSLTESEKMKVINAFDKAKNVKETKLVYEALVSNFTKATKKTSLKESIGFASKPTGPVKKKEELTSIFDSATVNRLQQLAGLKPLY